MLAANKSDIIYTEMEKSIKKTKGGKTKNLKKEVKAIAILKRKTLLRVICVLLILGSLFSIGAFALNSSAEPNDSIAQSTVARTKTQTVAPTLSKVPTRSVSSYSSYPITLWGSFLNARALLIGESLYIPMRAFSERLGLRVSYSSASRTLTVSGTGIYITVSDGAYVTYANDRALFSSSSSVIMNDGRMYVPIDTVMKAFGLSYSHNTGGTVSVFGAYQPLLHASEFYRSDEVLWLSRIISAESRGEPLLGQIAVGTVVMNRVASAYYPNTIYGVIFDKNYGIQFSPVADGTIYNTPTYNCTLAAKICLEGVRVGQGALFFLRPETSNSLWIPKTREYLYSIGNHDFYA